MCNLIEKKLDQIIKKELLKRQTEKTENEVFDINVELDTVKNNNLKQDEPAGLDVFGSVWVQNGNIKVKGMPDKALLPHITTCTNVALLVNDVQVSGMIKVSEQDKIEVRCQEIIKPGKAQVNITPDKLEAYLDIKAESHIKYVLVDQPEQKNLKLITTTEEAPVFKYSINDLLTMIQKSGIEYGLDFKKVNEIIEKKKEGIYKIAAGDKPIPPVDDHIAILFNENLPTPSKNNSLMIDVKKLNYIPSVEEGAVLAIKQTGKPGMPGRSVFGNIIIPKEIKSIELKAGKGTAILEKDKVVVATKPGRPIVRKGSNKWLFEIEECLILYGNVDISTGNQAFKGSVQVLGNIEDGMSVHAGGRVDIAGYCSGSEVISMEDARVGNIFNSTVQAGIKGPFFNSCKETLALLKQNLFKLISATEHLILKIPPNTDVRLGHVILVIIDKMYRDIPKLLRQTLDYLKVLPTEMPDFTYKLLNMIQENIPPLDLTIEKINIIIESITLTEEFLFQNVTYANVYSENVVSSSIFCTGDIYIQGQGCVASKLVAGNNLYVYGKVRGGEVSASNNIVIGSLGSEMGVSTIVKTPMKGKVKVLEKCYEGVVFKMGGLEKTVINNTSSISVFVKEGEIIIDNIAET